MLKGAAEVARAALEEDADIEHYANVPAIGSARLEIARIPSSHALSLTRAKSGFTDDSLSYANCLAFRARRARNYMCKQPRG